MNKKISAFNDSDVLGYMDATAISNALRNKELSATEVLEVTIARIEKVNPFLDALVQRYYDQAKQLLHDAKDRTFAGLPCLIKDSDNMKGLPTQLGTKVFKAKPASADSKFVNQIKKTGLVPLGKTTLPELGFLCSTENPAYNITRNPWNTDYTTGGSSSGSAAMVASGAVAIASANDGAGSIRIPASICGLVGLKPTQHRLYGLDGTELLPIPIIHQGVLTRTVRDTILFFKEAEKHFIGKGVPPLSKEIFPIKRKLRIGYVNNLSSGNIGYQHAETRAAQDATAAMLEQLGHSVEPFDIPIVIDEMVHHFLNYYGFIAYMSTRFSRFSLKAHINIEELEPFTNGLAQRFRKNLNQFPKSLASMRKLREMADSVFAKYDVMLSPVLAHPTPQIGYFSTKLTFDEVCKRAVNFATYNGLYNVTGYPSIALPLHFDSNGMPIGIQFSASYGQDQLLLELALQLEESKPFKQLFM